MTRCHNIVPSNVRRKRKCSRAATTLFRFALSIVVVIYALCDCRMNSGDAVADSSSASSALRSFGVHHYAMAQNETEIANETITTTLVNDTATAPTGSNATALEITTSTIDSSTDGGDTNSSLPPSTTTEVDAASTTATETAAGTTPMPPPTYRTNTATAFTPSKTMRLNVGRTNTTMPTPTVEPAATMSHLRTSTVEPTISSVEVATNSKVTATISLAHSSTTEPTPSLEANKTVAVEPSQTAIRSLSNGNLSASGTDLLSVSLNVSPSLTPRAPETQSAVRTMTDSPTKSFEAPLSRSQMTKGSSSRSVSPSTEVTASAKPSDSESLSVSPSADVTASPAEPSDSESILATASSSQSATASHSSSLTVSDSLSAAPTNRTPSLAASPTLTAAATPTATIRASISCIQWLSNASVARGNLYSADRPWVRRKKTNTHNDSAADNAFDTRTEREIYADYTAGKGAVAGKKSGGTQTAATPQLQRHYYHHQTLYFVAIGTGLRPAEDILYFNVLSSSATFMKDTKKMRKRNQRRFQNAKNTPGSATDDSLLLPSINSLKRALGLPTGIPTNPFAGMISGDDDDGPPKVSERTPTQSVGAKKSSSVSSTVPLGDLTPSASSNTSSFTATRSLLGNATGEVVDTNETAIPPSSSSAPLPLKNTTNQSNSTAMTSDDVVVTSTPNSTTTIEHPSETNSSTNGGARRLFSGASSALENESVPFPLSLQSRPPSIPRAPFSATAATGGSSLVNGLGAVGDEDEEEDDGPFERSPYCGTANLEDFYEKGAFTQGFYVSKDDGITQSVNTIRPLMNETVIAEPILNSTEALIVMQFLSSEGKNLSRSFSSLFDMFSPSSLFENTSSSPSAQTNNSDSGGVNDHPTGLTINVTDFEAALREWLDCDSGETESFTTTDGTNNNNGTSQKKNNTIISTNGIICSRVLYKVTFPACGIWQSCAMLPSSAAGGGGAESEEDSAKKGSSSSSSSSAIPSRGQLVSPRQVWVQPRPATVQAFDATSLHKQIIASYVANAVMADMLLRESSSSSDSSSTSLSPSTSSSFDRIDDRTVIPFAAIGGFDGNGTIINALESVRSALLPSSSKSGSSLSSSLFSINHLLLPMLSMRTFSPFSVASGDLLRQRYYQNEAVVSSLMTPSSSSGGGEGSPLSSFGSFLSTVDWASLPLDLDECIESQLALNSTWLDQFIVRRIGSSDGGANSSNKSNASSATATTAATFSASDMWIVDTAFQKLPISSSQIAKTAKTPATIRVPERDVATLEEDEEADLAIGGGDGGSQLLHDWYAVSRACVMAGAFDPPPTAPPATSVTNRPTWPRVTTTDGSATSSGAATTTLAPQPAGLPEDASTAAYGYAPPFQLATERDPIPTNMAMVRLHFGLRAVDGRAVGGSSYTDANGLVRRTPLRQIVPSRMNVRLIGRGSNEDGGGDSGDSGGSSAQPLATTTPTAPPAPVTTFNRRFAPLDVDDNNNATTAPPSPSNSSHRGNHSSNENATSSVSRSVVFSNNFTTHSHSDKAVASPSLTVVPPPSPPPTPTTDGSMDDDGLLVGISPETFLLQTVIADELLAVKDQTLDYTSLIGGGGGGGGGGESSSISYSSLEVTNAVLVPFEQIINVSASNNETTTSTSTGGGGDVDSPPPPLLEEPFWHNDVAFMIHDDFDCEEVSALFLGLSDSVKTFDADTDAAAYPMTHYWPSGVSQEALQHDAELRAAKQAGLVDDDYEIPLSVSSGQLATAAEGGSPSSAALSGSGTSTAAPSSISFTAKAFGSNSRHCRFGEVSLPARPSASSNAKAWARWVARVALVTEFHSPYQWALRQMMEYNEDDAAANTTNTTALSNASSASNSGSSTSSSSLPPSSSLPSRSSSPFLTNVSTEEERWARYITAGFVNHTELFGDLLPLNASTSSSSSSSSTSSRNAAKAVAAAKRAYEAFVASTTGLEQWWWDGPDDDAETLGCSGPDLFPSATFPSKTPLPTTTTSENSTDDNATAVPSTTIAPPSEDGNGDPNDSTFTTNGTTANGTAANVYLYASADSSSRRHRLGSQLNGYIPTHMAFGGPDYVPITTTNRSMNTTTANGSRPSTFNTAAYVQQLEANRRTAPVSRRVKMCLITLNRTTVYEYPWHIVPFVLPRSVRHSSEVSQDEYINVRLQVATQAMVPANFSFGDGRRNSSISTSSSSSSNASQPMTNIHVVSRLPPFVNNIRLFAAKECTAASTQRQYERAAREGELLSIKSVRTTVDNTNASDVGGGHSAMKKEKKAGGLNITFLELTYRISANALSSGFYRLCLLEEDMFPASNSTASAATSAAAAGTTPSPPSSGASAGEMPKGVDLSPLATILQSFSFLSHLGTPRLSSSSGGGKVVFASQGLTTPLSPLMREYLLFSEELRALTAAATTAPSASSSSSVALYINDLTRHLWNNISSEWLLRFNAQAIEDVEGESITVNQRSVGANATTTATVNDNDSAANASNSSSYSDDKGGDFDYASKPIGSRISPQNQRLLLGRGWFEIGRARVRPVTATVSPSASKSVSASRCSMNFHVRTTALTDTDYRTAQQTIEIELSGHNAFTSWTTSDGGINKKHISPVDGSEIGGGIEGDMSKIVPPSQMKPSMLNPLLNISVGRTYTRTSASDNVFILKTVTILATANTNSIYKNATSESGGNNNNGFKYLSDATFPVVPLVISSLVRPTPSKLSITVDIDKEVLVGKKRDFLTLKIILQDFGLLCMPDDPSSVMGSLYLAQKTDGNVRQQVNRETLRELNDGSAASDDGRPLGGWERFVPANSECLHYEQRVEQLKIHRLAKLRQEEAALGGPSATTTSPSSASNAYIPNLPDYYNSLIVNPCGITVEPLQITIDLPIMADYYPRVLSERLSTVIAVSAFGYIAGAASLGQAAVMLPRNVMPVMLQLTCLSKADRDVLSPTFFIMAFLGNKMRNNGMIAFINAMVALAVLAVHFAICFVYYRRFREEGELGSLDNCDDAVGASPGGRRGSVGLGNSFASGDTNGSDPTASSSAERKGRRKKQRGPVIRNLTDSMVYWRFPSLSAIPLSVLFTGGAFFAMRGMMVGDGGKADTSLGVLSGGKNAIGTGGVIVSKDRAIHALSAAAGMIQNSSASSSSALPSFSGSDNYHYNDGSEALLEMSGLGDLDEANPVLDASTLTITLSAVALLLLLVMALGLYQMTRRVDTYLESDQQREDREWAEQKTVNTEALVAASSRRKLDRDGMPIAYSLEEEEAERQRIERHKKRRRGSLDTAGSTAGKTLPPAGRRNRANSSARGGVSSEHEMSDFSSAGSKKKDGKKKEEPTVDPADVTFTSYYTGHIYQTIPKSFTRHNKTMFKTFLFKTVGHWEPPQYTSMYYSLIYSKSMKNEFAMLAPYVVILAVTMIANLPPELVTATHNCDVQILTILAVFALAVLFTAVKQPYRLLLENYIVIIDYIAMGVMSYALTQHTNTYVTLLRAMTIILCVTSVLRALLALYLFFYSDPRIRRQLRHDDRFTKIEAEKKAEQNRNKPKVGLGARMYALIAGEEEAADGGGAAAVAGGNNNRQFTADLEAGAAVYLSPMLYGGPASPPDKALMQWYSDQSAPLLEPRSPSSHHLRQQQQQQQTERPPTDGNKGRGGAPNNKNKKVSPTADAKEDAASLAAVFDPYAHINFHLGDDDAWHSEGGLDGAYDEAEGRPSRNTMFGTEMDDIHVDGGGGGGAHMYVPPPRLPLMEGAGIRGVGGRADVTAAEAMRRGLLTSTALKTQWLATNTKENHDPTRNIVPMRLPPPPPPPTATPKRSSKRRGERRGQAAEEAEEDRVAGGVSPLQHEGVEHRTGDDEGVDEEMYTLQMSPQQNADGDDDNRGEEVDEEEDDEYAGDGEGHRSLGLLAGADIIDEDVHFRRTKVIVPITDDDSFSAAIHGGITAAPSRVIPISTTLKLNRYGIGGPSGVYVLKHADDEDEDDDDGAEEDALQRSEAFSSVGGSSSLRGSHGGGGGGSGSRNNKRRALHRDPTTGDLVNRTSASPNPPRRTRHHHGGEADLDNNADETMGDFNLDIYDDECGGGGGAYGPYPGDEPLASLEARIDVDPLTGNIIAVDPTVSTVDVHSSTHGGSQKSSATSPKSMNKKKKSKSHHQEGEQEAEVSPNTTVSKGSKVVDPFADDDGLQAIVEQIHAEERALKARQAAANIALIKARLIAKKKKEVAAEANAADRGRDHHHALTPTNGEPADVEEALFLAQFPDFDLEKAVQQELANAEGRRGGVGVDGHGQQQLQLQLQPPVEIPASIGSHRRGGGYRFPTYPRSATGHAVHDAQVNDAMDAVKGVGDVWHYRSKRPV